MRMFVRVEARDALFRREDVLTARETFGGAIERIMASGKVEASGIFADARGGVFILDVASEDELRDYLFGLLDYAVVESHPLMTIDSLREAFQRDAG